MPKQKSRRAAVKRFRITRTGKVMRRQTKMRHLLSSKSSHKKRSLRRVAVASSTDVARVKLMLLGG